MRRHLVLGIALGFGLAGCQLFGLGDVPCETHDNCPADQYCAAEKVCRTGLRQSSADAAVDAGVVADGAVNDLAGHDAAGTDLARPDSAGHDVNGVDAAGVDRNSGGPCESPPCSRMPDSKTATCRDSNTTLAATCPTEGNLFGQDGNHNEVPMHFSAGATGVVHDDVTGLDWEQVDTLLTGMWDDAVTYCTDLDLGGQTDWRLPTARELITLLDYGRADENATVPSLDTTFFPSPSRNGYWSSSGYNSYYWVIDFWGGSPQIELDTNYSVTYAVRCVRGDPQVGGDLRFGIGTWIDRKSGLEWQAVSQPEDTLYAALAACEGLTLNSRDDWRVPSAKELETIVNRDTDQEPATYQQLVNDVSTASRTYWTSTPNLVSWGFWTINFMAGNMGGNYVSSDYWYRCVRGP